MSTAALQYREYPVFKGLQRPLEFMGLQGRYIYWAAATGGGAIVAFIVGYLTLGFVVGLGAATSIIIVGGVLIMAKQRKGLHSKNEKKGTFIVCHTWRNLLQ